MSDTAKLPLSVCLITMDEESTLAGCLESFGAIASELIVLDTGSTDRTREIAEAHGAIVRSFRWVDDFSAARNASLAHASQPWRMMVDADERPTPQALAALRQNLGTAPVPGVIRGIRHMHDWQHRRIYTWLWHRDSGAHFAGRVFEHVYYPPTTPEVVWPDLVIDNARPGWNDAEIRRRVLYYHDLLRLAEQEGSLTHHMKNGMAQILFNHGDKNHCMALLAAVANDPAAPDDERVDALRRLCHILLDTGRFGEAAGIAATMVALCPGDLHVQALAVSATTATGQWSACIDHCLEAASLCESGSILSEQRDEWTVAFFLAGAAQALDQLGDVASADIIRTADQSGMDMATLIGTLRDRQHR